MEQDTTRQTNISSSELHAVYKPGMSADDIVEAVKLLRVGNRTLHPSWIVDAKVTLRDGAAPNGYAAYSHFGKVMYRYMSTHATAKGLLLNWLDSQP